MGRRGLLVKLGKLELTLVLTLMILTSATAFLSYDSFQVFALSGVPVDGDGVPLEDSGDAWEGATVITGESDSFIFSSDGFAFDATNPTALHFDDSVGPDTTRTLVWEIDDPITLTSFHLIAQHDEVNQDGIPDNGDERDIRFRGFYEFRLYGIDGASEELLHTEIIHAGPIDQTLTGATRPPLVIYDNINDSPAPAGLDHYLAISRDVTTSTPYSKFKAEFVQAGNTNHVTAQGPRIVELDGYSDHSINLQSPSEGDVLGIGDLIIQFIFGLVLGTSYTSTVSVVENFGDNTQVFSSEVTFVAGSSSTSRSFSGITPTQDGEHTVTVLLQSSSSDTQSVVNVIVDTTPPTVFINSPTQAGFVPTATPAVLGSVFDATTTSVTVAFNGGSITPAVVIGNSWSLTSPTLPEGSNEIEATATDSGGNIAISGLRTFTVDTIPPVVIISAPLNTAILATATPTISGTVTDVTPTTVGVSFVGSGGPFDNTATVIGSNWSLVPNLADGLHNIVARGTDSAGNTANSGTTSKPIAKL